MTFYRSIVGMSFDTYILSSIGKILLTCLTLGLINLRYNVGIFFNNGLGGGVCGVSCYNTIHKQIQ